MEGDPRNPQISLLKKYDIPIDHISYEYVEKCTDKKELERIVRILRSGEEGFYPDLLKVTEDRLACFAPDSRVLRKETPVLTKLSMSSDEWNTVEKDLLLWEEEMMVIDKSLNFEKGRIEYVGNKNMPDIRKVTKTESKPKQPNRKELSTSNKSSRIKSGDYASWDKFDVDKELLKIDVEEERKEEENKKKKREILKVVTEKKVEINVDADSYTAMEQQVLANQAKDRGNECFKSGDLNNALKYYNVSLKLCESVNAYNNRAMTYLKLKQYDDAISDCNKVLKQEKGNIKALHRRATAYQLLASNCNNFDMLALEDLKEIVHLEPNNKVAQLDLHKLKTKLGIQDTGKKFRMPIYEADSNSKAKEESKLSACSDGLKNVDKLPLTYYGPSTSSYKCEPYSVDHRALSGSLLSPNIMCKCNSNILKQNPLCQKCGEAMCTPRPSPKSIHKILTETARHNCKNDYSNVERVKKTKEKILEKSGSINVVTKPPETNSELPNEVLVSSKICAVTPIAVTDQNNVKRDTIKKDNSGEVSNDIISQGKRDIQSKVNVDVSVRNEISITSVESPKPNKLVSAESDETSEVQIKFDNVEPEKVVEEIKSPKSKVVSETEVLKLLNIEESNQNDRNSSSKSMSKKKKSKSRRKKNLSIQDQMERLTPIKVVHADKYIHPTSVEPKVELEPKKKAEPEINLTGSDQSKTFTSNRQCLSVRGDVGLTGNYSNSSARKSAATSGESVKFALSDMEAVASLEGNKENFLKNFNANANEKAGKCCGKIEAVDKPEFDNLSPYEFAMLWDVLQKSDETYSKRARIIRSIDPSKLGEVIGVKLNCEMLITLLECLEKQFVEAEPKIVVDFLKQLPKIPRFGLIKMFLADTDKNVMKNLIASVKSKGYSIEEETVKGLTS